MIRNPEVHQQIALAESGQAFGSLSPKYHVESNVPANRRALRDSLPGLEQVFTIKPEGKDVFVDVDTMSERINFDETLSEFQVTCDGLVTARRRIALGLPAADCAPLVVAQPDSSILTLTHLGWKGAVYRNHEEVLDYARSERGLDLTQSVAYLGPSIQKQSYVTEQLHEIQKSDPDWQPHITEGETGFHVDIPGFVIATLVTMGVKPGNIAASPVDTGAPDSGYYSFVRHKRGEIPNGRNGFLAAIV